jgi:hypothetical protein
MENKFTLIGTNCVELNVDDSVEVLKKNKCVGWVVEHKLLTMMELMDNRNAPSNFDSLLQLEIERPVWAGVYLSLFNVTTASNTH